ncbi:hypothetical protein [Streptomyces glaucescens]
MSRNDRFGHAGARLRQGVRGARSTATPRSGSAASAGPAFAAVIKAVAAMTAAARALA